MLYRIKAIEMEHVSVALGLGVSIRLCKITSRQSVALVESPANTIG